jgi:hypothetical protein
MASRPTHHWSSYCLLLPSCAVAALTFVSPLLHAQTRSSSSSAIASKLSSREAKIREAEKALRSVQKAGASLDEQVARLNVLIEDQRRLTQNPSSTNLHVHHLQELIEEQATLKSRLLTPRIAAFRAAAEKALVERQFKTAAEQLLPALEWQRTINQSPAPASAKDISGESTLNLLLLQAEATPATDAITQELQSARQATKDARLGEATAHYAHARAAQASLNIRFAGTTFANQTLLTLIDTELAAAQAQIPLREIQQSVAQADLAASSGQIDTAAKLLAAALEKQRELSKHLPSATSASETDELDRKYQTVLSLPFVETVVTLDNQRDEALRAGDTQRAVTVARQALETLKDARDKFPKSSRLDTPLMRKFTYIGLRENELASIRNQVREQLKPVPSHAGLRMQKAEVSQALYTQIMNANPSRNPGGPLPVDSVNWEEAATFCRRLSWLMGATVRLPTRDEWQAATGSGGAPAWTSENSNARSQEAGKSALGPTGFCDLTGNVAEWLQPVEPTASEAPVAGGSFLDTADRIRRSPVDTVDRTARNRYIGFRVVIESD